MSNRTRSLPWVPRRAGPVLVLGLLAAALTFGRCPAQCEPVPNTGCGYPSGCNGSTAVGQGVGLFCGFSGYFLGLMGLCARPLIPLNVPIMCSGPCNLGVDPAVADVSFFLTGTSYRIPNDPGLIGAVFCMQCVPVSSPSCFTQLWQATRFTITP